VRHIYIILSLYLSVSGFEKKVKFLVSACHSVFFVCSNRPRLNRPIT